MKLSIITVVYNDVSGLRASIDSLLSQENVCQQDYEYIVIDGGSSDGTEELIKSSNIITLSLSEKDGGIYDAMNKGSSLASGEWLYFFNAGDTLSEPNTLSGMLSAIAATSKEGFLFGSFVEVFDSYERLRVPPGSLNRETMILSNPICHQASLVRTKDFRRANGFCLTFRYCADQDLMLRLLNAKVLFRRVNLTFCRYDTTGVSAVERRSVMAERARLIQKYGRRKGLLYVRAFFYSIQLGVWQLLKAAKLLGVYRSMKGGFYRKARS